MSVLTEKQKKAVTLYYLENMKQEDVCAEMGIAQQSVSNMIKRAVWKRCTPCISRNQKIQQNSPYFKKAKNRRQRKKSFHPANCGAYACRVEEETGSGKRSSGG